MLGRVRVSGIRFHAFHGLSKLERQVGVRHRVDVEMETDVSAAAESDRIEDTIDYGEIHELVIRIGRGNSFHLIEVLAMRIAREILENYPVSRVRIRVDKETPVLDGMVDSVGVEIELEQSDR